MDNNKDNWSWHALSSDNIWGQVEDRSEHIPEVVGNMAKDSIWERKVSPQYNKEEMDYSFKKNREQVKWRSKVQDW